ncbi:MAG: metalloenzyme, partial [Thermoanaerobaculia bacterium]
MGGYLLLFVDGVGLADESPDNPLATVPMPALVGALGGPLTAERAG